MPFIGRTKTISALFLFNGLATIVASIYTGYTTMILSPALLANLSVLMIVRKKDKKNSADNVD
jgi:hypothetical protein